MILELLIAPVLKVLDLIFLLIFGESGSVVTVTLSQAKKWCLVPFYLHILEVLSMTSLENTISVCFVVPNELFIEAGIPGLLSIEYLHDLRLVHEDVRKVKCLLHLSLAIFLNLSLFLLTLYETNLK